MMRQFCKLILLLMLFAVAPSQCNAFDSMLAFEAGTHTKSASRIQTCSGKITLGYGNFWNNCFPHVLGDGIPQYCTRESGYNLEAAIAGAAARMAGIGLLAYSGGGAGLAVATLWAGAEYAGMTYACTNYYVIQPWEYYNRDFLNRACSKCSDQSEELIDTEHCTVDGRKYGFVRGNVGDVILSKEHVPFFYHCDPTFDPTGLLSDMQVTFRGKSWGYQPEFCDNPVWDELGGQSNAIKSDMQNNIGQVRIEYKDVALGYIPWALDFTGLVGAPKLCDDRSSGDKRALKAGQRWFKAGQELTAYYKYDDDEGKIKICVGSVATLLPIEIGCAYLPPPYEISVVPEYLNPFLENTRCEYLRKARADLKDLSTQIPISGVDGISMSRFLKSDMHVLSTTEGCVNDMLKKLFVPNPLNNETFFVKVQQNMRSIAVAVITLYIMFLGIKISGSGQAPKLGEASMMIGKLVLVFVFAATPIWYDLDGTGTGIYHALIALPEIISSFFVEGMQARDLIGLCSFEYQGAELLQSRIVSSSGETTPGFNGVKLTPMDMIDCKFGAYFSFGSCNFNMAKLVVPWLVGAMIGGFAQIIFLFTSVTILLFWIALIVYCILLLMVGFQYLLLLLQALFAITILVFLSPILVLFALFDSTKQVTDQMIKYLLGYAIYPGLMFAFMALMFSTLDTIYYGDLSVGGQSLYDMSVEQRFENLEEACRDSSSMYCLITKTTENYMHPCLRNVSWKNVFFGNKREWKFFGIPIGNYRVFSSAEDYFKAFAIIALFSILFYLFLSNLKTFLSILLSVRDPGENFLGRAAAVDLVGTGYRAGKPLASVGGYAGKTGLRAAKDAAKTGIRGAMGSARKLGSSIGRRRR